MSTTEFECVILSSVGIVQMLVKSQCDHNYYSEQRIVVFLGLFALFLYKENQCNHSDYDYADFLCIYPELFTLRMLHVCPPAVSMLYKAEVHRLHHE